MGELLLREVTDEDLSRLFEQQLSPAANHMAAFTCKNPSDRDAFLAHWARNRADPGVTLRTIVLGGEVAGHIARFERDGEPEVSYWIGEEYWGRGIATRALVAFLEQDLRRPLFARTAKDNAGSIRVLQNCGFVVTGEDRFFANARGMEIEEWIFVLNAPDTTP